MGMDHHLMVIAGVKVPDDLWSRQVLITSTPKPCGCDNPSTEGKYCSNCGARINDKTRAYRDWAEDLPEIIRPFSKEVERPEMSREEFWGIWPTSFAKPCSFGESSGLYVGELIGLFSRWSLSNTTLSQKEICDIFERVEFDLRSLGLKDDDVSLHFVNA